jgi:PPM family protein phosphatase
VVQLSLECAVRSDVGRVRANNEDAAYASPRLAAVADGVGGAAAGEVASRAVIDALVHLDKCRLRQPLERAVAGAVAAGNDTVGFIARCRPSMAGMSTTLTAVALGDEGYVVANVGDSRTYMLRDRKLTLLTRDDSFVQLMLDSGELTAAEALAHPRRSLVLEALDGDPGRRPTMTTLAARLGDRLLLCSDGLTDFVDETAIADALSEPGPARCVERLVELALASGGRDNVSAVVADVVARRDPKAGWA